MNIEERIKNDLHNFLVQVKDGEKQHIAMDVEAYLINKFAKQMAIGMELEIKLALIKRDNDLVETINSVIEDTNPDYEEFIDGLKTSIRLIKITGENK